MQDNTGRVAKALKGKDPWKKQRVDIICAKAAKIMEDRLAKHAYLPHWRPIPCIPAEYVSSSAAMSSPKRQESSASNVSTDGYLNLLCLFAGPRLVGRGPTTSRKSSRTNRWLSAYMKLAAFRLRSRIR